MYMIQFFLPSIGADITHQSDTGLGSIDSFLPRVGLKATISCEWYSYSQEINWSYVEHKR